MNICFINPPFKAEYGKFSRESRSPAIGHSGVLYYPLWLIYAAALAEKNGFNIIFIDAPAKQFDEKTCLDIVAKEAKDTPLFVLDTSTPSINSDIHFAAEVKKLYPQSQIVMVGTHPTATVEETLTKATAVDIIARREYDTTILELASCLRDGKDWKAVQGISYKTASGIINNPDRNPIVDLDDIPMAAKFIKEHLDVYDYAFPAATYPAIQIFTGRGCPARCNYCVYPQVMHGHVYRKRSAENVVAEFEYIAKEFPEVKEIVIEDDTFTIDKARVMEICQMLIDKGLHKRFRWLCNARVNLDYDTMKMMRNDIIAFAKKRNPFNHPCIMYKKSDVEAAGGYQDFYLLEDYYLWIRMLQQGFIGYNLQEPLLWMRAGSNMYKRRGGWKYFLSQRKLLCYMYQSEFITYSQYLIGTFIRLGVAMAPNNFRSFVFTHILRK